MKKKISILMFVAGVFAVWLTVGSNAGSQQDKARNDKLKQLLQERLALTEKLHDLAMAAYRGGDRRGTFTVIHDAKMKLLSARLDLAETKEQRIKIHGDMVTEAANFEQMVKQLSDSGTGNAIDLFNAKVYHLERQIALERAKGD